MGDKKGKKNGDRPFYELPAHIKPCSRIIQETRMELSSGGGGTRSATTPRSHLQGHDPSHGDARFGSAPPNLHHTRSHPHPRGPHPHSGRQPHQLIGSGGGDHFGIGPGIGIGMGQFYQDKDTDSRGMGGIRVVKTQRPMTGVDHDTSMLWGVSARKRPPSAITLSRLSLDDIETEEGQEHDHDQDHDQEPELWGDVPIAGNVVGMGLGSIKNYTRGGANAVGGTSLDSADSPATATGRQAKPKTKKNPSSMSKAKSLSLSNVRPAQKQRAGAEYEYEDTEGEELRAGLVDAVNHLGSIVESGSRDKAEMISGLQGVKKAIERLKGEGLEFGGSCRARLLRLIFKLVETNQSDEDVVFWASFVLLHSRIHGNNLTTVFKMVFKASRWKEYWSIIAQTEYLDVFMDSFARICPLTQTESMIYGYGTLKFISMNKDVLLRVLQLDLVPIMTLHLKLVNYELGKTRGRSDKEKEKEKEKGEGEDKDKRGVPDSIYNAAFQLTSILRSVVGEESSLTEVVRTGLLTELCNSLWWTYEDIDVLSNIVRILSVVSSGGSECCSVISSNDTFAASVVDAMEAWDSKEDIIVRLTYTLGNLLAHSEEMRIKLFAQPGCYSTVLHLLLLYVEASETGKGGTGMAEDILIKTIRILANWSLNPKIGTRISGDDELCHILNTIIETEAEDVDGRSDERDRSSSSAATSKPQPHSHELLVCVMSTLNNITFYKDYGTRDVSGMLQTAHNLHPYLTWSHLEGRTEVMKVLGNLTRNRLVRKWVGEGDHVEKLMQSLWMGGGGEAEGEERIGTSIAKEVELISATLGVLMNIIVDKRACAGFLKNGGIPLLLALLDGTTEVGLLIMICQFLWNIHISSSASTWGRSEGEGGSGSGSGSSSDGEEEVEVELADPLAPVSVGDEDGGMSIKQRLEIRGLLRRKLESLDEFVEGGGVEGEGEEEREMLAELRLVGSRLFEKLGEK